MYTPNLQNTKNIQFVATRSDGSVNFIKIVAVLNVLVCQWYYIAQSWNSTCVI